MFKKKRTGQQRTVAWPVGSGGWCARGLRIETRGSHHIISHPISRQIGFSGSGVRERISLCNNCTLYCTLLHFTKICKRTRTLTLTRPALTRTRTRTQNQMVDSDLGGVGWTRTWTRMGWTRLQHCCALTSQCRKTTREFTLSRYARIFQVKISVAMVQRVAGRHRVINSLNELL